MGDVVDQQDVEAQALSTESNRELNERRAKMLVDNFGLRGCMFNELRRVSRCHPDPVVRDAAVRAMEKRSKTTEVRRRRKQRLKTALVNVDRKSQAAEKVRNMLALAMYENAELMDRVRAAERRCDRLVAVVKDMAADAKAVEDYLAQIQEALK